MNVGIKRRAFSLVELLIAAALVLCFTGGLLAVGGDSEEAAIRRDMAALENWLAGAMGRADRWHSDFDLSIVIPQSKGSRCYAAVRWWNESLAALQSEYFYADARLKWRLNVSARRFTYRFRTHSLSPAFVIQALNSKGRLSGDSLTVSVRGQITRQSGGAGK